MSAGNGVTARAAGTHKTGHGEFLTTRSISDPSTGVPPKSDA